MKVQDYELWEAMRTTKYNNTLNELKEKVNDAQDVDSALNAMLESFVNAVHAEVGTFWYYDKQDSGRIYPRAVYGGSDLKDISVGMGEGIVGSVIKSGESCIISNCEEDKRWKNSVDSETGFRTKSMICVPLTIEGMKAPFGAIQVINTTDDTLFDEKDLEYAAKLAEEIVRLVIEQNDSVILGQLKGKINLRLDEMLNLFTEKAVRSQLRKELRKQNYSKEDRKKIIRSLVTIYRITQKKR